MEGVIKEITNPYPVPLKQPDITPYLLHPIVSEDNSSQEDVSLLGNIGTPTIEESSNYAKGGHLYQIGGPTGGSTKTVKSLPAIDHSLFQDNRSVTPSDNTRVVTPAFDKEDTREYILLPNGEKYYPSEHQTFISADNRNDRQRKRDEKTAEKVEKRYNKALENGYSKESATLQARQTYLSNKEGGLSQLERAELKEINGILHQEKINKDIQGLGVLAGITAVPYAGSILRGSVTPFSSMVRGASYLNPSLGGLMPYAGVLDRGLMLKGAYDFTKSGAVDIKNAVNAFNDPKASAYDVVENALLGAGKSVLGLSMASPELKAIGRTAKNVGKYAKDIAETARFNLVNKGNGIRQEYPWQHWENNSIPINAGGSWKEVNGKWVWEPEVTTTDIVNRDLYNKETTSMTNKAMELPNISNSKNIKKNLINDPDWISYLKKEYPYVDWVNGTTKEDKVWRDIEKGFNDAINYFNSDIKKHVDERNKRYAKMLGLDIIPMSDYKDPVKAINEPLLITINDSNDNYGTMTRAREPENEEATFNVLAPNLRSVAFHEFLHRGRLGERFPFENFGNITTPTDEFYSYLNSKLFTIDNLPINSSLIEKVYNYYGKPKEGAAHLLQTGQRMGIEWGQKYPGEKKLNELLDAYKKKGDINSYIIDILNRKNPKWLWRALNGTLFAGATAITLNNSEEE